MLESRTKNDYKVNKRVTGQHCYSDGQRFSVPVTANRRWRRVRLIHSLRYTANCPKRYKNREWLMIISDVRASDKILWFQCPCVVSSPAVIGTRFGISTFLRSEFFVGARVVPITSGAFHPGNRTSVTSVTHVPFFGTPVTRRVYLLNRVQFNVV